jgi:hypothetical protein
LNISKDFKREKRGARAESGKRERGARSETESKVSKFYL